MGDGNLALLNAIPVASLATLNPASPPSPHLPPQVITKEGMASNVQPEYVLVFQPPLVVHNVLPHPITVILADSQAEQSTFTIGVGGFVEVYQFDMSRKIRMSINTQAPLPPPLPVPSTGKAVVDTFVCGPCHASDTELGRDVFAVMVHYLLVMQVLCHTPPLELCLCFTQMSSAILASCRPEVIQGAVCFCKPPGFSVLIFNSEDIKSNSSYISMTNEDFMQDCRSLHSVNIHYPPSSYVGDETRKSVIADLPGLRLAKQIALVRATHLGGASPALFGPQSSRLNLRLHNKVCTCVSTLPGCINSLIENNGLWRVKWKVLHLRLPPFSWAPCPARQDLQSCVSWHVSQDSLQEFMDQSSNLDFWGLKRPHECMLGALMNL